MAWMAMLGADSVAYHGENVIGRADDHPGQALAYYASRGETPLVWGGAGAERLGLVGAVTDAQYSAMFGPGGASDPTTGARLVATRRPGMDLVVSAHKTVAELGVIGRAEDMHAILDAERDATLAYLDGMVRTRGGRRGRARIATATGGLVYAHTRHATSRAGDPCPHDHVLVANVVEMFDEAGGFKALDTAAVRDHLHAATMVGRLAAARRAVELGYAIEADHGASGRLGHWRIVGVPAEVEQLHSKRSGEIHAWLQHRGHTGWRARQVAARKTREVKRHTPVEDLLAVWRSELETVGWTAEKVAAAVTAAGDRRTVPGRLRPDELRAVVAAVVDADGPLARAKVFHRRDVVVAVAPLVFGRPAGTLRQAVDAVLATAEAVPLLPTAGATERAWSLASVLATEAAIADTVARGTAHHDAAVLPLPLVTAAGDRAEQQLGRPLTDGQRAAVHGICTGGARVSLVLGVAGAGKTTALRAVADAYQTAGYTVLGTATSGQAARTLGREAGLDESRTLASLTWRLEHHQLTLDDTTVVILDEAGMTDDPALLRLLAACEIARAKVVLVGDDRQLSPVGPGGALGALLDRHGGHAHVLDENLRQHDPAERAALAELRAGDITKAVDWYVANGRVHPSRDRDEALSRMVDAWAADALAGRDVAMYAWQRRNVDALNTLARQRWADEGRLTGRELEAPGGRRYRAGDHIVTLSPGRDTVTSQRGVVLTVGLTDTLIARMDDGRVVRLEGDDLDRQHLAHGYAVTVHRAQGATVDVAHRFEDGGGRELAYVAMSRARHGAHAWLVADDLAQARDDLEHEWSHETRARWVIDTTAPDPQAARRAERAERAVDRAAIDAQRRALLAAMPADVTPHLAAARRELAALEQAERDLAVGAGRWTGTPVGDVAREVHDIRWRRERAEAFAGSNDVSRSTRRAWRKQARELAAAETRAEQHHDELAQPIRAQLAARRATLDASIVTLEHARAQRDDWLAQHPEAARRVTRLEEQLRAVDLAERDRALGPTTSREQRRIASRERDVAIDVGP